MLNLCLKQSLYQYLCELDKRQNPKQYIIDLKNQISDPKRLIEGRKLKTKRIDYDKD